MSNRLDNNSSDAGWPLAQEAAPEPAAPAEVQQALRAIEMIASNHSQNPREDAYFALSILRAALRAGEPAVAGPTHQPPTEKT